jgi:hypothetical protein
VKDEADRVFDVASEEVLTETSASGYSELVDADAMRGDALGSLSSLLLREWPGTESSVTCETSVALLEELMASDVRAYEPKRIVGAVQTYLVPKDFVVTVRS